MMWAVEWNGMLEGSGGGFGALDCYDARLFEKISRTVCHDLLRPNLPRVLVKEALMNREIAFQLCDELDSMIGDGPGDIHGSQKRISEIAFQFRAHPDFYVREKAAKATEFLDIWRSPRKWQSWGDDPSRVNSMIRSAVAVLRRALDSYERRAEEPL